METIRFTASSLPLTLSEHWPAFLDRRAAASFSAGLMYLRM